MAFRRLFISRYADEMNNVLHAYGAAFLFCLTVRAPADPLSPEKIVPRYYDLLTAVEKPSSADEQQFFGGYECDDVRAALSSQKKTGRTETPIWDYLRAHRDLFLTEGLDRFPVKAGARQLIAFSTPFRIYRKGRDAANEPADFRVIAALPGKKVSTSAYTGSVMILFNLGHECYLNIGGTCINRNADVLLEKLILDRSPHSPYYP